MASAPADRRSVGPDVEADGVSFVLADPHRRLAEARLQDEVGLGNPPLIRDGAAWRLHVARPPVDRMEYLFEVVDHNGRRATITDPANPLRAPGAFGDKSVVEFPGYAPPAWLERPGVDGARRKLVIEAPALDAQLDVELWSPTGLGDDAAAPLVVVHDGPEYDALGSFVHLVAVSVARGEAAPTRVALLGPGDRNSWYAANDDYAAALADALTQSLPPASVRVGVGVSLGALAMLHAHRRHPGLFDAVLLQSGSFFTADLDPQESGFGGFAAVSAFVQELHAGTADPHPIRVAMTCGTAEENLANNEHLARTLVRLGYDVTFTPVRDAHNYVAWRDALYPPLIELIRAADHAP